jgi:hypothetical protein
LRARTIATSEVSSAKQWKLMLNASDSRPRELDCSAYTTSTDKNNVRMQMNPNKFLESFSFLQERRPEVTHRQAATVDRRATPHAPPNLLEQAQNSTTNGTILVSEKRAAAGSQRGPGHLHAFAKHRIHQRAREGPRLCLATAPRFGSPANSQCHSSQQSCGDPLAARALGGWGVCPGHYSAG